METPSKPIPETFSVGQAFNINIYFFLNLWPLVEPKVIEEERLFRIYSLFFIEVCSGYECYAEWNEAVRRAINIPKEEQRILQLSLAEIFSCALEFCKLHNEYYNSKITYAVQLLEAMRKDPEKYKAEWTVWHNMVAVIVDKYMDDDEFDWSDTLSAPPNQKTDISKGEHL